MVLPLLRAGVVICSSDTQGRACYSLAEGVAAPAVVKVEVASDPEFHSVYIRSFNAERTLLETTEPRDPHEVMIPLPATGWGW